jgi:hypothetical protein
VSGDDFDVGKDVGKDVRVFPCKFAYRANRLER